MKNKPFSRRNFIKKSAATTGLASLGPYIMTKGAMLNNNDAKSRDEVWIAGISQHGLQTQTAREMIEKISEVLKTTADYSPDIICMPEVFPTSNIIQRMSIHEKIDISAFATEHFASLAKQLNSYIVCPVYANENGKIYNSAVLIDRQGQRMGEYRKIHTTEDEMEKGIVPGPLIPPVFETDFGTIGIQICFDIMWDDGWSSLKKQGAEFLFWPSAYSGGIMINTKARAHKYIVASSTRKNTAKLCDVTGEELAKTGIWQKHFYCAPVNRNRAFLHLWPYVRRFDEIRAKYGRKVSIEIFHEEEWAIIESHSPEVLVKDILTEFELKTYDQLVHDSENAQDKAREKQ